MSDPYNLQRFVDAQDPVYARVCAELRAGRKESHWMWYVFPQIEGLGHSPTAREFAISCREEAQAYLKHPILGPRLIESTELVNQVQQTPIEDIFGYPDHLKFHSSMTLFSEVTPGNQIFLAVLNKYFGGQPDRLTLDRL